MLLWVNLNLVTRHVAELDSHLAGSTNNVDNDHHHLPNEIMSLIVHHLSAFPKTLYQCTLVTKQCHAIANPLLWRAPMLYHPTAPLRFLTCLLEQPTLGVHIRVLHLRGGNDWTPTRLRRLFPLLPSLIDLTLTGILFPDTAIQHVPQLESLKLTGRTELTRASFVALGHYAHQLRQLDIYGCSTISLAWLALLLPVCPLKELIIHYDRPYDITEQHQQHQQQQQMMVIQQFDRLTWLKLTGVTPTILQSLLRTSGCWPRLTHLHLENGDMIDDTVWIPFIKAHPHLQHLFLIHTVWTDTSLDEMATCLPCLTHLKVTANRHISPDGVRRCVSRTTQPSLVLFFLVLCDRIRPHHFPEAIPSDNTGYKVHLDSLAIDKIRQQAQLE